MADLVRVRLGNVEKSMGAAHAERHGYEVLDEPARFSDGRVRPATRANGRPAKKKTSVAQAAAAKKDDPKTPDPATSTPEEANE